MTDAAHTSTVHEIVRFQIALLDLYESALDSAQWDEARVNETLKTFMMAVLALLRVQRSLGERVVTVQKDMIREYRERLEAWLRDHDAHPDGAPTEGWRPYGHGGDR
jgi:hypothetical protein